MTINYIQKKSTLYASQTNLQPARYTVKQYGQVCFFLLILDFVLSENKIKGLVCPCLGDNFYFGSHFDFSLRLFDILTDQFHTCDSSARRANSPGGENSVTLSDDFSFSITRQRYSLIGTKRLQIKQFTTHCALIFICPLS